MPTIKRTQTRVLVGRWLVDLLFRLLGGWVVSGQENVPHTGRVIICANHISDADPPAVLASLPRADFTAMAEAGLFKVPILGPLMRAFGTFPVKRDTADRQALRHAEEILEAERALVVFPEGRLSKTGLLQRVQPGAARLALRTGSFIVPVGVIGTNSVVPHGKLLPRRANHQPPRS
jgi:1-acyl-sn-glycerol-3-phosphate acyltransferase